MDANNTTSLLDAGNVTGLLGVNNTTGGAGGVTSNMTEYVLITLGIFVASWIALCIIMYFIAPFFARFGDMRSRIAYSAVYTLPFAIIFALGLGGTMSFLSQSNFLVSLLIAFLIVFGLVMFQNFLLGMFISKGIIKMESKRQVPSKANVKGKRK
ncbi:MAG TPA: hypothetical protein VGJ92_09745 [Methanocella sp.]|jgi:hypothetical protein